MSDIIATNVSEHIPTIIENVKRNRNDVLGQIETARQQTEVALEQVASMETLVAALELIAEEGLQGKVADRVIANQQTGVSANE